MARFSRALVLQFDLEHSAEVLSEIAAEQLRQCPRHLQERFPDFEPLAPKKTNRFQKGQFLLYLRILDAELAGPALCGLQLHLNALFYPDDPGNEGGIARAPWSLADLLMAATSPSAV
jgi:hypothetical protein